MKENIIALVTSAAFSVVGALCLFWPEKIRGYFLRNYIRGVKVSKIDAVSNWPRYYPGPLVFRILGAICLVFVALLIYARLNR
jgi:hypothetical protein